MNFKVIVVFVCILSSGLFSGCKKEVKLNSGKIDILIGKAYVLRKGEKKPLSVGDVFGKGDTIFTEKDSTIVGSFDNNDIQFELQPLSKFNIEEYDSKLKDFSILNGNVWLKLNKVLKGGDESLILKSPVTLAAVRGTKFYTFKLGEFHGTCFCQGKVDFKLKGQKDFHKQNQDYAVFVKDGKKITVTPEEFPYFNSGGDNHAHSMLDKSPLGKKGVKLSPEIKKKLMDFINKKFRELK